MPRTFAVLLTALLFLPARAADNPAGSWKLSLPNTNVVFLIRIEQKDGKWSGQYLGPTSPELPKISFGDVIVAADSLRFTFKIPGEADFQFEGKLPPDSKSGKINGSLLIRGKQLELAQLEPSKLKEFDRFEFEKETLEQTSDAALLADTAVQLMGQATEKKAKIEELRGWADKAFKPSDAYGVRWQRNVALRLARAVPAQKDYAPVAVEYARKAERLLDPDDDPAVQMVVLDTVAQVLTRADKTDDAKQIIARLAKLEERDYAEYLKKLPLKPEPFDGRKTKSDRAVLVELFTNLAADTGVAPAVALAVLEKTFKPSEVVILQYGVTVPNPGIPADPTFVPETIERLNFYKLRALPTALVNGKSAGVAPGPLQGARKAYAEFRKAIDPLLDKDAEAKLAVEATRKGNEIAVKANWSDLARTGEGIRLRFMLVENRIRYPSENGLSYHHAVVRAFPGGAKGTALTKKAGDQSVTANLDDIRKKLGEYLDDVKISSTDQLLALKNLRVVAIIQDDDSKDVLQAVQVEVK